MLFLIKLLLESNIALVNGILGGYDIGIEDAPYQINYGDICGGVLIARKWAITTAHCGTDSNFIRIGSKRRLGGPKVEILTHILHPKFGKKHYFDYDIQLLELHRRLHFSKVVSAIDISDGEYGENILVSGWGYPKEEADYNDMLQQVHLSIIPTQECQTVQKFWYNHTLTGRMFCAGGEGKDACQGDSGGAAVSFGRLVGISSFGFGCGRGAPGVYLNVSTTNIREWIRNYTRV